MPYKRTDNRWKAQVRKAGRRIEETFSTKREALEWEAEMRKLPIEKWYEKDSQTHTVCLVDWANSYLDFSKIKHSTKTYKEKKACFKTLFQFVSPSTPVETLVPGTVLDHLKLQVQIRSGYAANKDRKNLVAAWNWGVKYMGFPTLNPCLVDRFHEDRCRRYVPSDTDFWKVHDQAESMQDRIMLLSYLHTGARRSELFNLQWRDVDFGKGALTLGTRKRLDGSMEYDELPLTDELYYELLKLRQSATSQYVFPNPDTGKAFLERNHWMPRLCRKAGVKPFGLHAIRHLTASILAKAGISAFDIQAILRHKKLATTERYLHRLESLRPALRVLESFNPRLTGGEKRKAVETAVPTAHTFGAVIEPTR